MKPGSPVRPTRTRSAGQLRRSRWAILGLATLGAILSFGLWLVYASPVLELRTVDVQGVRTLPVEQVRNVAGVEANVPLARVPTEGIRRRVLDIPQVADVSVQRQWPHTLKVAVTEREAVAVLQAGSGAHPLKLVDSAGVAYPPVAADKAPAGLPTLATAAEGGARAQLQQSAGATVLMALPLELRRSVNAVEVGEDARVRLNLQGDRAVVWGDTAESGRKQEVLTALLAREARVYDVSVPGAPTTS